MKLRVLALAIPLMCLPAAPPAPLQAQAPSVAPLKQAEVPRYQYFIGQSIVPRIVSDSQANAALNRTHPYIGLSNASGPYPNAPFAPDAWGAQYVARWGSEKTLEADIARVPSWVTVCMYDNEPHALPQTPPDELDDPPTYYQRAARICHEHGKAFFATAGLSNSRKRDAMFATATDWDGYSMQTQTGLHDLNRFRMQIQRFRNAVLKVNPNAKFIAGVGDFARGTLMSPEQIEAAAKEVPRGIALWLNFGPHGGPACTDSSVCPIPARPDLEVQFIKDMAGVEPPAN